MDILQYVSGKRDKLNNDCANKNVLTNEKEENLFYNLDFTAFIIRSEVIP